MSHDFDQDFLQEQHRSFWAEIAAQRQRRSIWLIMAAGVVGTALFFFV